MLARARDKAGNRYDIPDNEPFNSTNAGEIEFTFSEPSANVTVSRPTNDSHWMQGPSMSNVLGEGSKLITGSGSTLRTPSPEGVRMRIRRSLNAGTSYWFQDGDNTLGQWLASASTYSKINVGADMSWSYTIKFPSFTWDITNASYTFQFIGVSPNGVVNPALFDDATALVTWIDSTTPDTVQFVKPLDNYYRSGQLASLTVRQVRARSTPTVSEW